MSTELNKIIIDALEDVKGHDIVRMDVREQTDVMDTLIIASGNSNRQVIALAKNVAEEAKHKGHPAIGIEGLDGGEWVLVDFVDTVVHIMLPKAREFYDLEKLWSLEPESRHSEE